MFLGHGYKKLAALLINLATHNSELTPIYWLTYFGRLLSLCVRTTQRTMPTTSNVVTMMTIMMEIGRSRVLAEIKKKIIYSRKLFILENNDYSPLARASFATEKS